MSFIVAMLLLYMDEFEAFKCFSNLVERQTNMDFYRLEKVFEINKLILTIVASYRFLCFLF